jgi:hypothetical protein
LDIECPHNTQTAQELLDLEAALGWDCVTCFRHSPPNLTKRPHTDEPRSRVTSLSRTFLGAEV